MDKPKYYIRLDDASPFYDNIKWDKIISILDKYNVKGLIGVIPDNKDSLTKLNPYQDEFWAEARRWEERGHVIALHGYDHCYLSNSGGVNPVHKRSEFAGVDFQVQSTKIKEGYKILTDNGINPLIFYAPSHTYDNNTIKALFSETDIRIISDTIAFEPYLYNGIKVIPQQIGKFRKIPFPGHFTFCFHPNNMRDIEIFEFENFIKNNISLFGDFSFLLILQPKNKRNLIEIVLQKLYYILHKI